MDNEIPQNKDIAYFAKTNFRNTNTVFGIKRKDRRQHMYVLGKSGTGKSVFLSNLIIQDIRNGDGVCVVDPHGELAEEILDLIPEERIKDVIYFNPSDIEHHVGFNVLEMEDPKLKHLVASGLMGIFTKIWANAWSSRMEYILNNAILALLDTPGTTLLGIPRLLVDKEYRQMIVGNLKDSVVKSFWLHEYEQWKDQFRNEAIAPIQNKVGQFLSTSIIRNVVGQSKSTINIFNIMNEGKIFIVNVSKGRIGEDNSALLGGMIITKIQLAAMERVRIPEDQRKDFYLYVDEFQNFATESFANILSEARKYRLNLIVAHQYIAQIANGEGTKVSDAVFGNVGSMIIFRVGAEDAQFLEREFEPEFTAQDLIGLPNFNIYLKLMIDGVTSRPFSALTLPPMALKNKNEDIKAKVIESSRKIYTKSKEEVENEIKKWSSTLQTVEGESKYKIDCSFCKKNITVPFEPKEGRPFYCKECLVKINSGEIKPEKGFIVQNKISKSSENSSSNAMLASLGIEFAPSTISGGNISQNKNNQNFTPKSVLPIAGSNKDLNHKNLNSQKQNFNRDNKNNFNKKFDNKNQKDFQGYNHKHPKNDKGFEEKKSFGPSPLLRGLLEKIKSEGFQKDKDLDDVVKEAVSTVPEPVSLSVLKGDRVENEKMPYKKEKEVSDEHKDSLMEALKKANFKKENEVFLDKNLDSEDLVKNTEDPQVKEDQASASAKKDLPKEVPEDVLRKILE